MKNSSGRFYDSPFLARKLSPSIASGLLEVARKVQLLQTLGPDSVSLKQHQIVHQESLLTYARKNYTSDAVAVVAS